MNIFSTGYTPLPGFTNHPNNAIPDAETFDEAVRLFQSACSFEATMSGDADGFWQRTIDKASRALAIWQQAGPDATAEAVEAIRALGDCDEIADALETGDFGLMQF